jgi:hypothetical protein
MKSPILSASYTARSANAAADRMVNMFPEAVPSGGKEAGFIMRAPCLRLLATVGAGEIRGLWKFGEFMYVVSGQALYKVTKTYSSTLLGAISGTGLVSMADNGIQLFVAANPKGYIYNANTNVFGEITSPDFPGAKTGGYLDGYFVFNEPVTQRFWTTKLLDGTTIDPTEFASAEGSPDIIVATFADHREAWNFGTDSVEIYNNTGSLDFPLERIQNAFIETGCSAAYSIAKLDNSLFWLGSDARGNGIIYRANGYTPARVSTHAVEYAMAQYSRIDDAIAYSYQQEGHAFYVITFPTGNATWVYDVATDLWHERADFVNGEFARHRGNCQVNFNNEIIVGDYQNGNIYALDLDLYLDNSKPQRWLRAWRALPTGANNLKRTRHNSLQIDCESGVGINYGQGDNPQMFLRWSDDGGHTWSNEHKRSMGKIGETGRRVIWHRLGATNRLRDRVYEISGTDPVKIAIMGAALDIS